MKKKKMSYDRIGNTRIRERFVRDGKLVGRKRSIFDKVAEIKKEFKVIIPEIKEDELIGMMSRCRNYYHKVLEYGRRKRKDAKDKEANVKIKNRARKLTINEQIIYDYMLKNNLNPSTTYRWFIATRLPSDLKEELEKGIIGQKLAMQLSANRRRTKNSSIGLAMMEDIRNIVKRLEWE